MQPRFRFAPSPNGYLHAGHALSAWFNLSFAQRLGGKAFLRIEDIDLGRTREAFVDAAKNDLAWLGLGFEQQLPRQSTRFHCYAEARDALADRGLLYRCFCRRADLKLAAGQGCDPDGQPLYDGRCRALTGTEAERRASQQPHAWRINMKAALTGLQGLTISHWNPLSSTCTVRPALPDLWGDALIVRKDTPSSYHLSVVVDDAAQGITHVVRGADLAAATDLHRLLQHLLGLPAPHYWHHPLLQDKDGKKLSKSALSKSLRDWHKDGFSAAAMLSMIHQQAGECAALLVDPATFA
jgi:glutamyl-Q tRNA(Asp) synthetase